MYLKMVNAMAENPMIPYIKNGLVLMLDGIQTGGEERVWVDLVGGKRFLLGERISRTAKGFQFANQSPIIVPWGFADSPIDYIVQNEELTVEAVFKSDVTNTQMVFCGGSDTDVNFVINNTYANIRQSIRRNFIPNTPFDSKLSTYSLSQPLAVQDTQQMSFGGNDYWGNMYSFSTVGGASNTTRFFYGEICAIRIYSRNLSLDEMLYNQQKDIERFGIQV